MKKNVRLFYSGRYIKVINAVNKANELLSGSELYTKIRAVKKFAQTDVTPDAIATLIETSDYEISVFAKFMPIANAETDTKDVIQVSKRNFSSDLATAVNTLIHETVHAVDWINGTQDFTHNSNDNDDHKQDNTAPWVIGAIAESLF